MTRPLEGFTAPAPGRWELETTHHGLRPLTPYLRDAYRRAFETGVAEMMERYGLPFVTVQAELVHGCLYLRPLVIGERPGSTPRELPAWATKLLTRVHPTVRRRARTAERVFAERRWRRDVDNWFDHERSVQHDANRALQSVEVDGLGDEELAEHLHRLLAHFETSARTNMAIHGADLVPTGDLLAHCLGWGIDAKEAAGLLTGSSPATVETADILRPLAEAMAARGSTDSAPCIDDERTLGADVRDALRTWHEVHAWRTVTSDDVDQPTWAEVPRRTMVALLGATSRVDLVEADATSLRRRVPAADRGVFDDLVAEARYGHRQRDDVRGLCWDWPCGLLRRSLLEAGRRLHRDGKLRQVDHVVELVPDELDGMLRGGPGPSADQTAERAAERDRIAATPPPRSLGRSEAAPSLDVFPNAMARVVTALMATRDADTTPSNDHDPSVRSGVGIGSERYRGRACVVEDLMRSIDELRPGDVLIAPFTGPAVSALLPVIGGLVVDEGGSTCHAAIVAREFGLPAVIGARDATTRIPHGADVEIDPLRGTVHVTGPGLHTEPETTVSDPSG